MKIEQHDSGYKVSLTGLGLTDFAARTSSYSGPRVAGFATFDGKGKFISTSHSWSERRDALLPLIEEMQPLVKRRIEKDTREAAEHRKRIQESLTAVRAQEQEMLRRVREHLMTLDVPTSLRSVRLAFPDLASVAWRGVSPGRDSGDEPVRMRYVSFSDLYDAAIVEDVST